MTPARVAPYIAGALVLVALTIGARAQHIGIDEGVYAFVTRAWVQDGVPPYQGPIENKTPGIYYVYAVSQAVFGSTYGVARLLAVASMLGCCLALHRIGRRLYGDTAGLVAMLIGGLALSSRNVRGRETAMTESFMVCFTTLAVLAVLTAALRTSGPRWRWMFAAGLALGVGIAFKQIALVTGPTLGVFAWAATPSERRGVRGWILDMLLVSGGVGLATVASLVPLWLAGVSFGEYWQGAWLLLLDHGSMVHGWSARLAYLRERFVYPTSTLAVLFAVFLACRRALVARGVPCGAIAAWVALDWIGVSAAGSYLPHQFKQVIPVLSLTAGIVIGLGLATIRRRSVLLERVAMGALLAVLVASGPWQSTRRLLTGQGLLRVHGPMVDVGEWVRDHTQPGDYVYTWVIGGIVQTLSDRPSPSRYFNPHFVSSAGARQQILRDLERHPPRMIVVGGRTPPWLADDVETAYRLVRQRSWIRVYERRTAP